MSSHDLEAAVTDFAHDDRLEQSVDLDALGQLVEVLEALSRVTRARRDPLDGNWRNARFFHCPGPRLPRWAQYSRVGLRCVPHLTNESRPTYTDATPGSARPIGARSSASTTRPTARTALTRSPRRPLRSVDVSDRK